MTWEKGKKTILNKQQNLPVEMFLLSESIDLILLMGLDIYFKEKLFKTYKTPSLGFISFETSLQATQKNDLTNL